MQDDIYTRALRAAAELEGSRQALASLLNAPENTLVRWMAGRAHMPLQLFRRVIDLLVEHERREPLAGVTVRAEAPAPDALRFTLGRLLARCARCGGDEFGVLPPGAALRYASELYCRACQLPVMHAVLIAGLAKADAERSYRRG